MILGFRLLSLASNVLLSLWWGGFSFYAARVVFIGHEVLRSKIRQGFITERVTTELNCLALAALAAVGWTFLVDESKTGRRIWVIWGLTLLTSILLFPLHMKLAAMLDFSSRQLAEEEHFYGWHRIYLSAASVQWIFGTILMVHFHARNNNTVPNPASSVQRWES